MSKTISLFDEGSNGHAEFIITMCIAGRMDEADFNSHWARLTDEAKQYLADRFEQLTGQPMSEVAA